MWTLRSFGASLQGSIHSVRMYAGSALRRRHWESFVIIQIPDEGRDSDLDLADSRICAFWVPRHLPEEEEEGSHDVRKMVLVTQTPVGWKLDLVSGCQEFGKFPVGSGPGRLSRAVFKNNVVKQHKVLVVSSPYTRMLPGLCMWQPWAGENFLPSVFSSRFSEQTVNTRKSVSPALRGLWI